MFEVLYTIVVILLSASLIALLIKLVPQPIRDWINKKLEEREKWQ